MRHKRNRFYALMLALVLASSVPTGAFADTKTDISETAESVEKTDNDGGAEAPTTKAAEPTEAATTKAPETTEAPTTKAAETEAPTTKAPETEAPTTKAPETEASSESEQPAETEASAKAETTKEAVPSSEAESAEESIPELPAVPSGEDEIEAIVETETADASRKPTKGAETSSSVETSSTVATSSVAETLGPIVHDYIIEPELIEDFRFRQIDRVPAILANGAQIYTEKDENSDVVGVADGTALVYVIDKAKDWIFVESDYVRGFARRADLTLGDDAKHSMAVRDRWYEEHEDGRGDKPFGTVESKMSHLDNPAFTFTLTTTMDVQADKVYAIAADDLSIYDDPAAAILTEEELQDTKVLGTLAKGGLAYVLVDNGGKTVYVESSDVRGFVNRELLEIGEETDKQVKTKGETKFTQAQQKVDPKENRVLYYSIESVEKPGDAVRKELVKFALQFVGNPYLWGGTSLTHGTDCSGFTQSVYAHFGYSIPRTSGPQANFGTNMGIKPENAKPGDIVCYSGHVAIYIGDGQIVHASNHKRYPAGGIKVSSVNIRPIIAIRRIIP